MERQEKQNLMEIYGEKLGKAISREKAIKKEKENDKLLLKTLQANKDAGLTFENEVYENYEEWIETIEKQIKKSDSALANIEFKKILVEAVQEYSTKN